MKFIFSIIIVFSSLILSAQNCGINLIPTDIGNVTESHIINSNEGGSLLAASVILTDSTHNDVIVKKFNEDFTVAWSLILGTNKNDIVTTILQNDINQYFIIGYQKRTNFIYLAKVSSTGILLTETTIENTNYGFGEPDLVCQSGTIHNENLYLIGNYTGLENSLDGVDNIISFISKINFECELIKFKSFEYAKDFSNSMSSNTDYGLYSNDIISNSDNELWITGHIEPYYGSIIVYPKRGSHHLMKIDTTLKLIESLQYDDLNSSLHVPEDILKHTNGSIYIYSWLQDLSFDGSSSGNYLTKLDSNGLPVWAERYSSIGNLSLKELNDGNLLLSSKRTIIKVDTFGHPCWRKTFPYEVNTRQTVIEDNANNIILSSTVDSLIMLDSTGNHCSNLLSGYAYYDKNRNCIRDKDEFGVNSIHLSHLKSGISFTNDGTVTHNGGFFYFFLDTNEVKFYVRPFNDFWEPGCSMDSITFKFANYKNKNDTINIPIWTQDTCSELGITSISTFSRICTTGETKIKLSNRVPHIESNVKVIITLPEEIVFLDANLDHTLSNNEYTFEIPELRFGNDIELIIKDSISCDVMIDDVGCIKVEMFPHESCDTINETVIDSVCILFGNSFDPNSIDGYINTTDTCFDSSIPIDQIEYLVQFENKGNAPALQVVVVDTFDLEKVDISTLITGKSSHKYSYKILEDSIIHFEFDPIYLADTSDIDYPYSARGWFKFKIDNLILGEEIVNNRVSIYFDNNLPIHTNLWSIERCLIDIDQDGFYNFEDCDDENADVNPDAIEITYNGIDDDCNELTLDDDLDQDGFNLADDCDDENAEINPDAIEVVYNGIDDDCNELTLDDDLDQDGFNLDEDCDDENADVNPDAIEIVYNDIDDDCNELTLDDDLDQDGFNLVEDCDDENADINPDAIEVVYNGIDDDCNELTLDDDLDQDGFNLDEDCDDENADVNPDAIEIVYNDIDDDCNELTLDDDLDQDGFNLDEDCDDENSDVNPDAVEIPNNGIDEDCDGSDLISNSIDIESKSSSIFPNPTNGLIKIKHSRGEYCQIIDINGKLVKVFKLNMSVNETESYNHLIDIRDFAPGLYSLKIISLKHSETNLIMKY